MGREAAYCDASFEALKAIRRIVAARIRQGAKVFVDCQIGSLGPGAPTLYYICFTPANTPMGVTNEFRLQNEPGIPKEAAVPEKIGTIAYWIIKQIREKRPEWFVKDGITGL